MTFLYPEFIYMMLPVLLFLFGLLLTQSEVQEQFFSLRVLSKLRVDTNRLSAKVRNFFYFLMFLFIILALAGPVIEKGRAKVEVTGEPLYIALDISASMQCEDIYPNRLEFAKQKVSTFLGEADRNRIGLIAFSQSSYLVSPATLDHHLLHFLLKPMNSSYSTEEGTNLLTVLKAANKLYTEGEEKRLLIVSDGGEKPDLTEEIAYAKQHKIKVYTLGVGTKKGAVVPKADGGVILYNGTTVISRLNPELSSLARASGGADLQPDELITLAGDGTEELSDGEEKPIYFHLFVLPIAFAMLMLVLATSSFHRGEKYYLPSLLVLGLFWVQPHPLNAALLDFKRLEKANSAYENEAYGESARIYQRYALEYQSREATYNAANSYYKRQQYGRAAELYESIHFVEAEKNHRLYHNLGNALARLGDDASLQKAISAYNQALKFRDDNETRENLQQVEELLQRRKEASRQGHNLFPLSTAAEVDRAVNKSDAGGDVGSMRPGESVMSDREADKWFSLLDERQRGAHYKIDVADPGQGAGNAKPW